MSENENGLGKLSLKFSELLKKQESFQNELEELRLELEKLQLQKPVKEEITAANVETEKQEAFLSVESMAGPLTEQASPTINQAVIPTPEMNAEPVASPESGKTAIETASAPQPESRLRNATESVSQTDSGLWKEAMESRASKESLETKTRSNLEKFIGENLINKIGIVILIIGVGIGAKYAIDHQLISPLTRIILGYLVGLVLLGFAIHLKKDYLNFSAVLLSGSMAILYFITFAAYSFFELIPLTLTFALMALFTICTVAAAIVYDRQVISHIGLVGAYAVPFLLSDNSGKVVILFSYMSVINAGILVIAFRKYWKPLYYSSFFLSWLIFISWFITGYRDASHYTTAWIFISIFFATFYVIFLAYKLLRKEKFRIDDILLLLANSVVLYGVGYALLYHHLGAEKYRGLFTLLNGIIHFVVSIVIFRVKQSDKNLFYFTAGLVIAFITIAIPVQLDGNWVTMLWAVEAAGLFWLGRTRNTAAYELLSYAVMVAAFFCIALGWPGTYHTHGDWPGNTRLIPLFNVNFLTSLLFIASFAFINILNVSKKHESPLTGLPVLKGFVNFIIPGILLTVLYFSFYLEIDCFWNQQYAGSMLNPPAGSGESGLIENVNINYYKTLSLIDYSLLFLSLLSLVNIKRFKSSVLGLVNLGFSLAAVGVFLTAGLIAIGNLRESYIAQDLAQYYYRGSMLIGLRYVSFLFLALMVLMVYRHTREEFLGVELKMEFDFFLHLSLLTILANELINWMDLSGSEQSYKLGLSILFGSYSVILIILGIWKKKMHLRIGAIVLFSLTLLKLFFYDLSSLDTIAKTIVFVVLGVLLLVISFLYNKYRKLIFEENKD